MKMLIILGLREDETRITGILKKARIPMYSRFNITGPVNDNDATLSDKWFAATAGQAESIAYFSFAEGETVANVLNLVKKTNEEHKTLNPIHGFIVPVEAQF